MRDIDRILEQIEQEGEYKEFVYKGITCKIIRNRHLRHLCGYVVLPKCSAFHGVDYNDIPIDCHGGLTYGGEDHHADTDDYMIGFDCAHSDDLTLSLRSEDDYMTVGYGDYRDMRYVQVELESMVDQLLEKDSGILRMQKINHII